MNEQSNYKYVLYLRKSTDDPIKQTRSIEDQLAECLELAKVLQLNVVNINAPLIEKRSAKKAGKRPIFNQMMKDLYKGKYDGILAWNPDRLARNSREGGEIIDMVDEGIIKDLKFKTHTFTNDANGKMLLGMAFVLSKQYSDDLSQKVTRGVRRSFAEGKSPAPKHGYERDEHKLYRPNEQHYLIKEAWKMRLEGHSLQTIVTAINNKGYKRIIHYADSRPDKHMPMTDSTLSTLFKDPFYYGVLVQKGQSVDLRELYDFEPAVSEDDYFKIQRIDNARIPVFKKAREFYPFKKMITCNYCHSSMYVAPATSGSTGQKYLYMICQNKSCTRPKKNVRMKVLLEFIYTMLSEGFKITESDYKKYISNTKTWTEEQIIEKRQIIHNLEGTLKSKNREMHELSLKIIQHDKSSSVYKEVEKEIQKLEFETTGMEEQIKTLREELIKTPEQIITLEQFLELSKTASNIVKSGSALQKDIICRLIFSNFKIGEARVTEYSLNPPFDTILKNGNFPSSRSART